MQIVLMFQDGSFEQKTLNKSKKSVVDKIIELGSKIRRIEKRNILGITDLKGYVWCGHLPDKYQPLLDSMTNRALKL